MRLLLTALLILPFFRSDCLGAEVFRADDPILVDHDNLPSPKPQRRKIYDYWDFVENTFLRPGDRVATRAKNINTLGGVPDSSWYTNRIGSRPMTVDEIVRGPDSGTGPAPGTLTVIEGKSQGISPGFTVEDSTGVQYFLKFDPPENPEMATGAEVISTALFHAVGYNVPENYIIVFDPSRLAVDPAASVVNNLGEKTSLTIEYVRELLDRVAHTPDGSIRAIASRRIEGSRIGPFKFHGTRGDDPNDVIPHEHRRELRAYRVFCAWLNHDDSRSINSLDLYVPRGDTGYVKHYLIDFGSTLGSGSVRAQKRRAGNEYVWEAKPTFTSMLTFGLWMRPWVMVEYLEYPAVGRFESKYFRPEVWKPEYPNPAFDLMDDEDAFWAARQVMQFSDDAIRAVVMKAQFSDPAAAEYLAECIMSRRDKIGAYWLSQVSWLDDVTIDGDRIAFRDLRFEYGFAGARAAPRVALHHFDNATGERSEAAASVETADSSIELPAAVRDAEPGSFFVLSLAHDGHALDIFLRKEPASSIRIVGIQRD